MRTVNAIIADDEAPLRSALRHRLQSLWPELVVAGEAKNGIEALDMIRSLNPQVAFLDIRMPGLSGIDVAAKVQGLCRVVFVTAFDQYAVDAFEKEALDYIVKPVTSERLKKTVARLKAQMEARNKPESQEKALKQLVAALAKKSTESNLNWIKPPHGDGIRLIAVEDVCCFKASDKYTAVITAQGEFLINKSIKELAAQLDNEKFWQIHRSTIVKAHQIVKVSRSMTGRYVLKLKDYDEPLTVSRRYTHLFKQM
jgi:DNA-binding LytR/AlgR family response regulator